MRLSPTLAGRLLRSFLPAFLGATLFFVLLLQLADLFANLWRYLSLEVPAAAIAKAALLYAPTCVSYALPISLLFATAFALGSLYATNELVVVFGSGISLPAFVLPLLLLAGGLCAFSFWFEDSVVIGSYRAKTILVRELLKQSRSLSNADVSVLAEGGRLVYRAEFYDDASRSVSGMTLIERDQDGTPRLRAEAAQARWEGGRWILSRARIFERGADGVWTERSQGSFSRPDLVEPPESFRSQNLDLREMRREELAGHAAFLARAGLPAAAAEAEIHKRRAFALTPLVVVLLSAALGGRFRKNVLLLSLLSSLIGATGYYVVQMVGMLLAKNGAVAPAAGAWAPTLAFGLLGLGLFARART